MAENRDQMSEDRSQMTEEKIIAICLLRFLGISPVLCNLFSVF
jgi:hypothetical protein